MRSMVEGYLPLKVAGRARDGEGVAFYPSTTFGGPPPHAAHGEAS
jgi:hypothetical protein